MVLNRLLESPTFSFATTFLLAPISLRSFGKLVSLVLVKVQKFLVCVIA